MQPSPGRGSHCCGNTCRIFRRPPQGISDGSFPNVSSRNGPTLSSTFVGLGLTLPYNVTVQWLNVMVQWLNDMVQWLNVMVQWLNVMEQWLNVMVQWVNVMVQ